MLIPRNFPFPPHIIRGFEKAKKSNWLKLPVKDFWRAVFELRAVKNIFHIRPLYFIMKILILWENSCISKKILILVKCFRSLKIKFSVMHFLLLRRICSVKCSLAAPKNFLKIFFCKMCFEPFRGLLNSTKLPEFDVVI